MPPVTGPNTKTGSLAIGCLVFLLFLLVAPQAAAAPDDYQYQMPMAAAPRFASEAIATQSDRRSAVITAMACGSELHFIAHVREPSSGEDIAAEILGKLAWVHRSIQSATNAESFPPICEFTIAASHWELCKLFDEDCESEDLPTRVAAETDFIIDPAWTQLSHWSDPNTFAPDVTAVRNRILTFLPPECGSVDANGVQGFSIVATAASATIPPVAQRPAPVRLTFKLSRTCLIAEANVALLQMERGELQLGTDGLPCHYTGVTKGDWDSTLKVLMRAAELDRRQPLLSDAARKHLNDSLLDIDGGPAQERYHLWECGNEERSVGDPQTRSDDHDGFDSMLDDLWDSKWDLLSIFLFLLLLFLALFFVALALWTLLGGAGAAILAGALAAAALGGAALLITLPETENHLWMINSTKYLNNQYIMANGGTGYSSDQTDLREWILKEMQTIAKKDFIEYNSRPYARYSLVSIANLADFAQDIDIRTGARVILESSIAKYAVTSSEGRRIAPYRRKREDLHRIDGGAPRDGKPKGPPASPNGLFDLIQGSDHLHAIGLYYFGSSLNLLAFNGNPYAATTAGYPAHAIYYATSDYTPDETTYSLAIERASAPLVHQRLHHYGYEIVSSGASFTITAGGHTTGMAKNVIVDFIDKWYPKARDDLGAAVPTTLMLAGPPDVPAGITKVEMPIPRPAQTRRSTLDAFLRFDGVRPEDDDKYPSYDRNLCVWDGFACGVNIVIPSDLKRCMKWHHDAWYFIRSDFECDAYAQGPPFYIALFYKSGPAIDVDGWGKVDSEAFLEIVDGTEMDFEEFKRRVLARNRGPGSPMHLHPTQGCNGAYVSARGSPGQRIEFSCERVEKVDGIEQPEPDDWGHAGSPAGALGVAPIQSSGNGKSEITSVAAKRKVILSFERWDDPRFDTATLP